MEFNETAKESWSLLNQAQKILPFGNPVQKCYRVSRGKPQIVKRGNNYGFTNVVTCGSSWSCPICSPKKAGKRARAVRELHSNLDYDSVLVTYTVQHTVSDRLKELMDILYDSLRYARKGKRFAQFKEHAHGYIRSTEVVYGQNGWHPHIHELIYVKKGSTIEDISNTVVRHYKSAVARRGLLVNHHTVDTSKWNGSTDYITKNSDIDEVIGWVNKSSRKSVNVFGILRRSEDSARFRDLYQEYYFATKRRKVTIVSRSLSEAYKDAVETVESEEEKHDEEVIYEFDPIDWSAICRKGIRYQILLSIAGVPDQ